MRPTRGFTLSHAGLCLTAVVVAFAADPNVGTWKLNEANGTDQAQVQGYEDRSKYRAVVGTKYARELILK